MSSSLLTDLVTLLSDAWPALASADIHVSVGGGTSTLDPLILGTAVQEGGGPCPYACGTVNLTQVRGLATMVAQAELASLSTKSCTPPAIVLTIPVVLPQLEADAEVTGVILGAPIHDTPTIVLANVGGTLTVTLPVVASTPGADIVLEPAQLTANLYLDLQQVASVTHASALAAPLLNDLLRAGIAPIFARLASHELTSLVTNALQGELSKVGPISVPAWLLPSLNGAPATPQPCTLDATFQLPCDPCDTCCICATQSRCADDCAAQCAPCMPVVCKPSWSWSLILTAIVAGLLLLALLTGLGWGLVALARRVKRHHFTSHASSNSHVKHNGHKPGWNVQAT